MAQAAVINTTSCALTLADLNTTVNHEPRIQDVRLAEALGFERPREIKRLIERHEMPLQKLGGFCVTVTRNLKNKEILLSTPESREPAGRGRPGKTYWLNKKQALYLCTKSETANATEVTIQMVEVFDAYLAQAAQDRHAGIVPVRAHARRRPKPGYGTVIADTDRLHPFIVRGDELVVEFTDSAALDLLEPGAIFVLLNPTTRKPEPHWLLRDNGGVWSKPDPNQYLSQSTTGERRPLVAHHWPVLGRVVGINKPTQAKRQAELARCA